MMPPVENYWIVLFENGEQWKFEGPKMLHSLAVEQASARLTKVKCFLYGQDNFYDEFFPHQAFDADGNPDNSLLLVNLLDRGLNSKNIHTAAIAAVTAKALMKEIKKDVNNVT